MGGGRSLAVPAPPLAHLTRPALPPSPRLPPWQCPLTAPTCPLSPAARWMWMPSAGGATLSTPPGASGGSTARPGCGHGGAAASRRARVGRGSRSEGRAARRRQPRQQRRGRPGRRGRQRMAQPARDGASWRRGGQRRRTSTIPRWACRWSALVRRGENPLLRMLAWLGTSARRRGGAACGLQPALAAQQLRWLVTLRRCTPLPIHTSDCVSSLRPCI